MGKKRWKEKKGKMDEGKKEVGRGRGREEVTKKEKRKKTSQYSDIKCVLAICSLLVFEWSLEWHSFMFLMLFCSNSARKSHFSDIQLVFDGPTDGWTHPVIKMLEQRNGAA